MARSATVRIDVLLEPEDLSHALRSDVREGLTSSPKQLPPKWFYDDRGSELFDEITRLPEYYLTRREREILAERAGRIAAKAAADTLVELGSGTSEKTRILLDALTGVGTLRRFVPFDVSEGILRRASEDINRAYPNLDVHAVVGDFERHLTAIPDGDDRLFAFLGGTIGNFPPPERAAFLRSLAELLHPGDSFLLGCDLIKDIGRLEAAYNDSAGLTAEFNRNVLRVIDRELDADLDPDRFEHVAFYDADASWIEMRLRSVGGQTAHIGALGLTVTFEDAEEVRTELSAKFTPDGVAEELAGAGLDVADSWTDDAGDFALVLATPR